MRRKTPRGGLKARRWRLALAGLLTAAVLLTIAALAQRHTERRLEAEAAPAFSASAPLQGEEPAAGEAEDAPDPELERLVQAAEPPDASLAALNAAAHALLLREDFEDADGLVRRALSAAPKDAENGIHRAVLRGVEGDTQGARVELERLAAGPQGWEASMWAAGFALRDNDDVAALRALRRYRAQAPADQLRPELGALISELEARLRGAHKESQKQP